MIIQSEERWNLINNGMAPTINTASRRTYTRLLGAAKRDGYAQQGWYVATRYEEAHMVRHSTVLRIVLKEP